MQTTGTQKVDTNVVAAITAALMSMTGKQYVAVHIERNSLWTIAGRLHR
ncbi:hypothetical protein [Schwartzia sp. (in: firmicutes)]